MENGLPPSYDQIATAREIEERITEDALFAAGLFLASWFADLLNKGGGLWDMIKWGSVLPLVSSTINFIRRVRIGDVSASGMVRLYQELYPSPESVVAEHRSLIQNKP